MIPWLYPYSVISRRESKIVGRGVKMANMCVIFVNKIWPKTRQNASESIKYSKFSGGGLPDPLGFGFLRPPFKKSCIRPWSLFGLKVHKNTKQIHTDHSNLDIYILLCNKHILFIYSKEKNV